MSWITEFNKYQRKQGHQRRVARDKRKVDSVVRTVIKMILDFFTKKR
jgi:hypothetical protein